MSPVTSRMTEISKSDVLSPESENVAIKLASVLGRSNETKPYLESHSPLSLGMVMDAAPVPTSSLKTCRTGPLLRRPHEIFKVYKGIKFLPVAPSPRSCRTRANVFPRIQLTDQGFVFDPLG